jgi:endonuclease I
MQFKGLIFRVYMFFGTRNQNLRSVLKPEVELMCFCACAVTKSRKTAKNDPKMRFEGLISRTYMFLGTRNPNFWSILKPEVELMVFLRMRINKITKDDKNVHKMQFKGLISRVYMFFGTRNQNLRSVLKPEVELMCFCACAVTKSRKTAKNDPKMRFEGLISRMYIFLVREIRISGPFLNRK